MLGFALLGMILLLSGLLLWKGCYSAYTLLGFAAPKINNWPVTIGIFTAIIGWMVSAWVTLRNSIKQHTFNFWLQTRCSAKYMEHAEKLNKWYIELNEDQRQQSSNMPEDFMASVFYILNHAEFIAVGIRMGDLDEFILKQATRSMTINLYETQKDLITRYQKNNPKIYEHLTALYHRWK